MTASVFLPSVEGRWCGCRATTQLQEDDLADSGPARLLPPNASAAVVRRPEYSAPRSAMSPRTVLPHTLSILTRLPAPSEKRL